MIIMPAIELKEGKCVRMSQVDFRKRPSFSRDPVTLAQQWQAQGAEGLHIYDWDAVKAGKPVNVPLFRKMADALQIPLQVKGGLRFSEHVEEVLSAGVDRVVLENHVLADHQLCRDIFNKYDGRVAASVRAQGGLVLPVAWPEPTDMKAEDLLLSYKEYGLKTVMYKDLIEREEGPETNVPAIVALKDATGLNIIASGGISSLLEVRRLTEAGVYGCVIGRALYNETINFKNALAFARWG